MLEPFLCPGLTHLVATFLTLLSKSKADSVLSIEPFGADCGISITAVSCGLKNSSATKSGLFFLDNYI